MNIMRLIILTLLLISKPVFAEYYISYTAPEPYRTCYNCYKETVTHGADYKYEGFRQDTRIRNHCYEESFAQRSIDTYVDSSNYVEASPDKVFGTAQGYSALDADTDYLLTNDRATADDLGSELQITD